MKLAICAMLVLTFSCRTPDGDKSHLSGQIKSQKKVECEKRIKYNPQPSPKYIQTKSTKAKVKLLIDNEESWYARWHILKQAKKTIDVQYYIIEKDEYGQALLGMLLEKQLSGVKVRIMVDGRGSPRYSKPFLGEDILQELVAAGVEVIVYNPFIYSLKKLEKTFEDGTRLTKSILKGEGSNEVASEFLTLNTAANHDKLIIVDSEYVIVGGRNISGNYFQSSKTFEKAYDDLDVLIHSRDIAKQAHLAFLKEVANENNSHMSADLYNINSEKSGLLKQKKAMDIAIGGKSFNLGSAKIKVPSSTVTQSAKENIHNISRDGHLVPVAILDNASAISQEVCDLDFQYRKEDDVQASVSLLWAIANAKKEIWIFNPYIVMTDEVNAAFAIAAKNNVKITLITNSVLSTDSLLTQAVFIDEWKSILRKYPNLRIFVSKGPSKLHGKAFIFDDSSLVVGSYNLDAISQNINSEIVAYIEDPVAALQLKAHFENFISKKSLELYYKDGKYHGFFELSRHSDEFETKLEQIKSLVPLTRYLRDRI